MIRRQMLATLGAAVLAAAWWTPAPAADVIKVGEINSYTRLPAFTEPYKKGWELAVDEINASGGIGGKTLVVISRDDGGKPGNAVKIAEELVSKDGVALLAGTFFSNIGLAVTDFAKQNKTLFIASEPLSDALVWAKGNRYTFRLRPSTYMQASMLAAEAAKLPAKKWATIAPNYAYGKDAVAAFKKALTKLKPDVEFIEEQWPALFKIDAGATVRALEAAKPEGIYNATFGGDLAKFVREGSLRGLFDGRTVVSFLSGEPEYLDPLKAEAPKGWLVTGYPWYDIGTAAHETFVKAYQAKYGESPKTGSLVGYNTMLAVAAVLNKAGSTDTEDLVTAMEGLSFDSPSGPITFRAIDHQSTMGAWVGRTAVRDGKGVMVDWFFADGANYLPSDDEVMKMRPAN
ncbi:MAG: ABC transporter substrate-binding protein [Hyphomicrobiales bacterium]|nr:ABC transporter substrate-binding protein [Hyphomicrobiales bacterium]MCP5370363.1 ABC transporter substrate-binding protein [Hyphomicrobiales bacterium]